MTNCIRPAYLYLPSMNTVFLLLLGFRGVQSAGFVVEFTEPPCCVRLQWSLEWDRGHHHWCVDILTIIDYLNLLWQN